MTFAITALGILKEKKITIVENRPVVEYLWTNKLREGKIFSSRTKALDWLKINGFDGFAYNPKEQENIKDRYIVVKRRNPYSFEDESITVNEWVVEKAIMLNASDLYFLMGRDDSAKSYELEEAKAICRERNLAMLKDLTEKIKNQEENYKLIL